MAASQDILKLFASKETHVCLFKQLIYIQDLQKRLAGGSGALPQEFFNIPPSLVFFSK